MERVAIYARISAHDQHIDTQLFALRELASGRGFEVVQEYTDVGVSGSKARRRGLDTMLADAHRRKFSIVLVAAFDRIARSVRHFLSVIDELNDLGIEFISARENVDSSGALGRMFITILGSIAELECSLIIERIKAGMHRRRLEGLPMGRTPLNVDHAAIVSDRLGGMSLTAVGKKFGVSRASVIRWTRDFLKSQCPAAGEILPVTAELPTTAMIQPSVN
jgi:DNA invertase Pin-like site-specific DNA recombinase